MTIVMEPPRATGSTDQGDGREQRCRVCHCTDGNACDPACWWIADDLCSSCEGKD